MHGVVGTDSSQSFVQVDFSPLYLVLILLMSGIARIYDELARAGFADGTMYVISGDNHIVELVMYAGFIVSVKCRGRGIDQIVELLKAGDFKQVRLTPGDVRLEAVNPDAVRRLAGFCAADALKPATMEPERMVRIISLISYLDVSTAKGSAPAAAELTSFIERFYPTFSFDRAAIQKRIVGLSAELSVMIPGLHQDVVPDDAKRIPAWIVTVLEKIPSVRLRGFVQYYLLFGESPQKMLGLTAKKDTSLGAKPGSVKLSKTQYPAYTKSSVVTLFCNLQNAGDFNIIWHSENKRELLITKADYEHAGIGQNDNVIVLFH